jgi:hypothetical protein
MLGEDALANPSATPEQRAKRLVRRATAVARADGAVSGSAFYIGTPGVVSIFCHQATFGRLLWTTRTPRARRSATRGRAEADPRGLAATEQPPPGRCIRGVHRLRPQSEELSKIGRRAEGIGDEHAGRETNRRPGHPCHLAEQEVVVGQRGRVEVRESRERSTVAVCCWSKRDLIELHNDESGASGA